MRCKQIYQTIPVQVSPSLLAQKYGWMKYKTHQPRASASASASAVASPPKSETLWSPSEKVWQSLGLGLSNIYLLHGLLDMANLWRTHNKILHHIRTFLLTVILAMCDIFPPTMSRPIPREGGLCPLFFRRSGASKRDSTGSVRRDHTSLSQGLLSMLLPTGVRRGSRGKQRGSLLNWPGREGGCYNPHASKSARQICLTANLTYPPGRPSRPAGERTGQNTL